MSRKLFPSRAGFKILHKLNSSYGMTPSQLSVDLQISEAQSSRACKELLAHNLLESSDIIDRFEYQLKITDEGRRVHELIEPWHSQGWWKRRRSSPPNIT